MYEFEHVLPHLDPEYRRKIAYSIMVSYHLGNAGDEQMPLEDWLQIEALHHSIQRYDMFMIEARGGTNTNGNPFDLGLTPHH